MFDPLFRWVEESAFSVWMRESDSLFAFPGILAVHTIGLGLLAGLSGAFALRLLGVIATHRTPPEVGEAEADYRQALALAESLGMRPLQAHCHLGLGTLYAKAVMRDQARAELSTAIELYRAMEMTFWLPQAEAAMALLSGGAG